MKSLLSLSICFFISFSALAQDGVPEIIVGNEFSNLLSKQQYSKKNISMKDENGDLTHKSLQDIDDELEDILKLVQAKNYERAYPMVAELSQWGVKEAQAIMGTMYMKGQHVEKSTELGLVWLGVAKEGNVHKPAKKSFDYVYSQLNDEQRKYMDQKVDAYIAKYGSEEQKFICKSRNVSGSNIRSKRCLKTPGTTSILYPLD